MAFNKNRKRGCCALRATALLTPPVANKVGKIPRGFSSKSPRKRRPSRQRTKHLPDERETSLRLRAAGVDAAARTPLMLQTVLGGDAARIASPFLVSPAAMGQRLVRDKKQNFRTVGQSAEDRDGHLNSENPKSLAG
jgi:predicted RNA polymerase sigma factor